MDEQHQAPDARILGAPPNGTTSNGPSESHGVSVGGHIGGNPVPLRMSFDVVGPHGGNGIGRGRATGVFGTTCSSARASFHPVPDVRPSPFAVVAAAGAEGQVSLTAPLTPSLGYCFRRRRKPLPSQDDTCGDKPAQRHTCRAATSRTARIPGACVHGREGILETWEAAQEGRSRGAEETVDGASRGLVLQR